MDWGRCVASLCERRCGWEKYESEPQCPESVSELQIERSLFAWTQGNEIKGAKVVKGRGAGAMERWIFLQEVTAGTEELARRASRSLGVSPTRIAEE